MANSTSLLNAASHHWVTVHAEPAGQFTAQAVGLPEVRATAPTRAEAIARAEEILRGLIAAGELVAIQAQPAQPVRLSRKEWDPNDPEMLAYMEILAQHKKEDLEQTLRELDQECSNSSSTPTT
jgi:hypothetical protein